MPGIVGKIGGGLEALPREIDRMVASMMHEPFYGSGAWVDDLQACGLGAIFHEQSFADGQPYWNAQRNVCLVFSGECFGLEELVPSPNKNAESASCLLELYERFGIQFLEKLNGIFSGALADLQTREVFLFNDRYGLGRTYFHQAKDAFYFASEAKALLSVRPELRELDPVGLAEQFSCGCTLQNRTLFAGVSLLPGGSVVTLTENGKARTVRYFDPAKWEAQSTLDEETYQSALNETFSRVLPRYFRDESALAMSLTGGLDGRMIMAAAPHSSRRFPCYTFGGTYRDCADVSIARKVAKVTGHSHQVLPVDATFLRQFPQLAARSVYLSDGTMDVGGAVELYANRLARAIAPIRLTGNYGSEILRRNVAFRPNGDAESFLTAEFREATEQAAATYRAARNESALTFIAFKQVPWHHYSRFSLEQSQLTVRSPYLDNELVALAYRAPLGQLTSRSALQFVYNRAPMLARIPTDRGLLFAPRPLLTELSHNVREFSVRAEYAYDYGMPQTLARVDHLLAPLHLERLFLGRHKFYHFRIWYRDQLAPFVREILLDSKSLSRPYIERARVKRLVAEHTSGQRNHTLCLHKLLTIELTQRQLIETSANAYSSPEPLGCAAGVALLANRCT
ncbi:MAG: asparagine synthetase B family protein [Chthoniobacterales bacterium]